MLPPFPDDSPGKNVDIAATGPQDCSPAVIQGDPSSGTFSILSIRAISSRKGSELKEVCHQFRLRCNGGARRSLEPASPCRGSAPEARTLATMWLSLETSGVNRDTDNSIVAGGQISGTDQRKPGNMISHELIEAWDNKISPPQESRHFTKYQ